jgi:hypothetical protein
LKVLVDEGRIVSHTSLHIGIRDSNLGVARGCRITIAIHADQPWHVLGLVVVRNDTDGILLERTRRSLIETFQTACRTINEGIQSELNLIAEVGVELIQRGRPEVLASRSFIAEPKGEVRSVSFGCGSGTEKSEIASHHAF